MMVRENPIFTQEYYDPAKRHIGNAVQLFFRDGTSTARVQVDFPVGHRKRRAEGLPLMHQKYEQSVAAHYPKKQLPLVLGLFTDAAHLDAMPVQAFMAALVHNGT